ncbi:MAG: VOC family protein [Thermoleophilia bacterium]|jgi:methylmalonyl-CoA/ethylmalonyl-CoA epimerase|nr:VOC family protein [Thermoleophilia bacterium]
MPRFDLKPHHGGISVPDLDASIAWYRDMLGFTVDLVMDIPADTGRLAMLKNGDFRVELFEVPGAAPLPDDRRYVDRDIRTHGMKHMAYLVRDVEALIAELRARGVDIVWDVQEHGGMKAAFIRDNSGNLVELMEGSECRH